MERRWRRGGERGGGGGGGWREVEEEVVGEDGEEVEGEETTLDILCPYKGWTLYFTEGFIESSPSAEKIKVFEKYFSSKIQLYDKVLTIDLEKQASELHGEELPVSTPIINIPHISARYCTLSFDLVQARDTQKVHDNMMR
ncbi:hypothetical protein F7725_023708 [Dissostichus mawsoni]|uniref:Uncharacterized protein n=1 Tax=Dissostichus mawsoni TaxID=36200 RepID=A0A7J5XZ22_DISMA|nr:hypothetical protein F7725_023708 [Dissostichus mawsoni]